MEGMELIKRGPMMAKAAGTEMPRLSDPSDWELEPKLDGWRFLWIRDGGGVRSFAARNGNEHTGRPGIKEIEIALTDVLSLGDVVDGELLAPFDDRGPGAVAHLLAHANEGQLQAWLFDALHYRGADLTSEVYVARRTVLDELVPMGVGNAGQNEPLVHVPHMEPREGLFEALIDEGLEGVVLKHRRSIYRPGKRGTEWLKVKPQQSVEAKIVGFVDGKGRLAGEAGAFELEVLDSGVRTTCSTRDDDTRTAIRHEPERFLGKVAEIAHMGIMPSGKPRHPVFVRLREDRDDDDTDPRGPVMVATPKAPSGELDEMIGLSPARSDSGRIRMLKQMGAAKFDALVIEMAGYAEKDPKAFAAVMNEARRRHS